MRRSNNALAGLVVLRSGKRCDLGSSTQLFLDSTREFSKALIATLTICYIWPIVLICRALQILFGRRSSQQQGQQ